MTLQNVYRRKCEHVGVEIRTRGEGGGRTHPGIGSKSEGTKMCYHTHPHPLPPTHKGRVPYRRTQVTATSSSSLGLAAAGSSQAHVALQALVAVLVPRVLEHTARGAPHGQRSFACLAVAVQTTLRSTLDHNPYQFPISSLSVPPATVMTHPCPKYPLPTPKKDCTPSRLAHTS